MKKVVLYVMSLILTSGALLSGVSHVGAYSYYDKLTQNDQKVVVTDDITTDPLRAGANNPGSGIKGLYYNGQIFSFFEAQNQTIGFIQRIVNWALAVVGIIALVYLLYNGFLMVTAAGDDSKFKKGAQAARTTAIALIGIGLSAFIVNFIFYIVDRLS